MAVVNVDGVFFSYPATRILEDITFEVERGDCVAILGTNGVGKSTLLKCINKILIKEAGKIHVNGVSIDEMTNNQLARNIGYVVQSGRFSDTTVFDAILLGRKPYIKWDVEESDLEVVRWVIQKLSLENFAMRNVNKLSGGEAQKVAIGRAMAQKTSVLLLDEPTSNLDLRNQLEVLDIIKEMATSHDVAAIVTMHDLNLALRFADKFILMQEGMIWDMGGKEIITADNIKSVYSVDVTIAEINGRPVIVPV